MKTIETLQAEHAAALAKLENELNLCKAAPIPPDAAILHGKNSAPSIIYRKRSMADAAAIFAAFLVVPAYDWRGTFRTVAPEPCTDKNAENDGSPFAMQLIVAQGEGYGPSAELNFYARIDGGQLVRVAVDIEGPDYIGDFRALAARVSETRDHRGRVERRSYGAGKAAGFADRVISYSSGSGGQIAEGARFVYLFVADKEGEAVGSTHQHALGQWRNLADSVLPAAPIAD